MKWLAILACIIISASYTQAADVGAFFNKNSFLTDDYLEGITTGVCEYNTAMVVSGGSTAVTSTQTGYWPSTGTCSITDGNGVMFKDDDGWQAYIDRTAIRTGFNNTMRAAFSEITDTSGSNYLSVDLNALPYSRYSNYTGSEIPLFDLTWCGEKLLAEYSHTTVAPSSLYFTVDYDGGANCRTFYSKAKQLSSASYGFYSTAHGEEKPFELPLNRICQSYKLIVQEQAHGDWPARGTHNFDIARTDSSGNVTAWKKELGSNGDGQNWFWIYLDLNSARKLEKIRVDSGDRSPSTGGGRFTVVCVNPIDPDTAQNYCSGVGAWWPSNAGPAPANNACCGDDTTDAGNTFGEYRCERQVGSQQHSWRHLSNYCAYPSWWQFGSGADEDPKKTYHPSGGCCSDPANFGKNITSSTQDSVCSLTARNEAVWMNATQNHNFTLGPTYTQPFISNGTKWFYCNGTATTMSTTTYQDPIPRVPVAGACTAYPDTCSGTYEYERCMMDCDPDGSGNYLACQDTCMMEADCSLGGSNTNCEAYPGTACSQNMCTCSSTSTWNGTACEPYTIRCSTAGFTPNPTIQKCQKTDTFSLGTRYLSVNKCSVQGERICLENWTEPYNSTYQYLLNSTGHYIKNMTNLTWKATATQMCVNGANVTAYRKERPQPAANDFGFCLNDQCYLEQYQGRDLCVGKNNWTFEHLCTNTTAAQSMTWVTRTNLLADLFYEYAQNESMDAFVLHCDNYSATINDIRNITPYNVPAWKLVNEFCVLSDSKKAVAVGVSLNDKDGKRPSGREAVEVFISDNPTRLPFVTVINDEDSIKINEPDRCNSALANDGLYHACATDEGHAWYNAAYGTLVMSTNDIMRDAWYDSIRRWWNSLFTPQVGSPLVSLDAEKVFIAHKVVDDRTLSVQGSMRSTVLGTNATIVYQNINATRMCNAFQSSRLECGNIVNTSTDTFQRVYIRDATQQEWESFTFAIRP